jgi:hypothetical protein
MLLALIYPEADAQAMNAGNSFAMEISARLLVSVGWLRL